MSNEVLELEEVHRLVNDESAIPSIPVNHLDPEITIEYCNQRTKCNDSSGRNSRKFVFNYKNTPFEHNTIGRNSCKRRNSDEQNSTGVLKDNARETLDKLVTDQKWDVISHPFALNYIYQILIGLAFVYTSYIFASIFFFFFLAWHIVDPAVYKNIFVVICLVIFMITRVLKKITMRFFKKLIYSSVAIVLTTLCINLPFGFIDKQKHETLFWLVPILALTHAWLNLLYVLRKSPFGIYVLMMMKIMKSFAHIAVIWVPTLIFFSFTFLIILRDSKVEPWSSIGTISSNSTFIETIFVLARAMTKTSTMMIGEVDVDDILKSKPLAPCIIVLIFEIITVILLMNLMISVAVGDVNDLRKDARKMILKIKVDYVIEALQHSELFSVFGTSLSTKRTLNGLVINDDRSYVMSLKDYDDVQFDEMTNVVKDGWSAAYAKWLVGFDITDYLCE